MTEHLTLPGGTRLDYFVEGEGDALLVYHHGTPAAGPIPRDLIDAATDHGFVIAELVRPGYGQSTRQPGRSVADVVPLVEALADHLGHAQFVTMGWSGGGPHAIATAALLPQRCTGAMSLAGVAPYGEPDLDFLAGMGEDNIAEFGAALEGDSSLEAFLSGAAGAMRDVTADQVIDAMRSLLPAVDQAHLTGQEAEEMAAELRWSSHMASGDGSTTTSPSRGPGDSTWAPSRPRSRSGRARTTSWCPSPTVSGLSSACLQRSLASSRERATCHWPPAHASRASQISDAYSTGKRQGWTHFRYRHSSWHPPIEFEEIRMDEKTKKDLEDATEHTAHGIEDVADVVGHGIGGAVKGVADGVESASAESQVRKAEAD